MAEKNIPDKMTSCNIYKEGNRLVGVTDEITLPSYELEAEEVRGFGMVGGFNSPSPMNVGPMEQEITMRMMDGDAFEAMGTGDAIDLTIRGGMQRMTGTGAIEEVGARVVERGFLKSVDFGTMKQGSPMNATLKYEVIYLMIEIDGVKKLEIDKLNCVHYVNGKDLLEKARKFS